MICLLHVNLEFSRDVTKGSIDIISLCSDSPFCSVVRMGSRGRRYDVSLVSMTHSDVASLYKPYASRIHCHMSDTCTPRVQILDKPDNSNMLADLFPNFLLEADIVEELFPVPLVRTRDIQITWA